MAESPLFIKTYDLVNWVLDVTARFPRTLRFNLAEYLQRYALDLLDRCIRATQTELPSEVHEHLREAGVMLALIRSSVRLSTQKGCLTPRQLEFVSEQLREISNLLRAWQRKVPSQPSQTVSGATTG